MSRHVKWVVTKRFLVERGIARQIQKRLKKRLAQVRPINCAGKNLIPHFLFVLAAGDAFFVFHPCTVYIPLQFYSVAAWKMSLPCWAEEYQDHTSNAEKENTTVE